MTMNGVWRKVWEDCVQDFRGFEEPVRAIQQNIVQLAKETGLGELGSEDIQELMDSQGEELTTGEIMEIQQERSVEEAEDSSDSETEESARALTTKGMAEAFQHLC
jgi:hypothetical protein